jgi:uncharacterized DUF497 family protein
MQFTWSERKRAVNLKDHGLDFVDAPAVFEGITFTYEDTRFAHGDSGSRPMACLPASRFQ